MVYSGCKSKKRGLNGSSNSPPFLDFFTSIRQTKNSFMNVSARIKKTLAASIQRLVFVILLLSIFYLLSSASPAFAQSPNAYTAPNLAPDVPRNLHTWTQTVTIEVLFFLICFSEGMAPAAPNSQCLGVDQKTGGIGDVGQNGGAMGRGGKMIGGL